MARIINPIIVQNLSSDVGGIRIMITSSLNTPSAIKAHIETIISRVPDISSGDYYVFRVDSWSAAPSNQLCFFNVSDGIIVSESAIRISSGGNLTARAWSSADGLSVKSGDVFEFIKAGTNDEVF